VGGGRGGGGAVVAAAPGHGIVHQRLQDALEVGVADLTLRLGEAVELHGHEELVADVDLVVGQDKPGVQTIVDELLDGGGDHRTAPPSGRRVTSNASKRNCRLPAGNISNYIVCLLSLPQPPLH